MNIVKGMPGLKQASRLANERLVHHLGLYGYAPVLGVELINPK